MGRTFGIGCGALLLVGMFTFFWVKGQVAELEEESKEVIEEAEEFGESATDKECLKEALSRYDDCDGFACHTLNQVFLTSCLGESSATMRFCKGVPASDAVSESVSWRIAQCEQHERRDEYCTSLMGAIQSYCDTR